MSRSIALVTLLLPTLALLAPLARADDPATGGALSVPTLPPVPAAAAPPVAPAQRVGGPGYLPPVMHITTDPLMPQKYRSVPAGKYGCSVNIVLDATGKPIDVLPVECDQESLWALSTAIITWEFEPALQDGVPVVSQLAYSTEFEVKTLLPRKHVVGFVGLVGSIGGESILSLDGRVHLGEMISLSGGLGFDQNNRASDTYQTTNTTFHGDVAFSSPRQYFEHRGIFGGAIGFYSDTVGQTGLYGGFRGELMTPSPGLSIGGDIGIATVWHAIGEDSSLGLVPQIGKAPFYPWLRLSVLWYAPLPRDQFVVVPRVNDPVVYEAIIEVPPPVPDEDGAAFVGVPAVHWTRIPASGGRNPVPGAGFENYPPGQYTCNVRVLVAEDGSPEQVRVEKCPPVGKDDAAAMVKTWKWAVRPGEGRIQAVFPAPFFINKDEAEPVRADSVMVRAADGTLSAPRRTPEVWVHHVYTPVFQNGVEPTGACSVVVDLDVNGTVVASRWKSGEPEIRPRVLEALAAWKFYPVAVDGELAAVQVTLPMCGYPQMTTQAELDAASAATVAPTVAPVSP